MANGMKISCATQEQLWAMTPEQKWEVLCGEIRDDGKSADVALLLGSNPPLAIMRAEAAAELYRAGRVPYIVPSGGVEWEYEGEKLSEADLMARVLRENGVPEEAIILDNMARTTVENMLCGAIAIHRKLRFSKTNSVIIVTSVEHMRRSIGLAKAFLPRKVEISAYPAFYAVSKEEWLLSKDNVERLNNSLRYIRDLVHQNTMEDFDIPFL
jgi:uncharacterized SAM-binding protein YcdF (DUF218 family)